MRILIVLLILCILTNPIISVSIDNTKLSINIDNLVQYTATIIVIIVVLTIVYNIITDKKP